MNRSELLYSKTHEWVKMLNETTAQIGLTDFAQESLGDIVFVNLPDVGQDVVVGTNFSDVESVKAVSDIYSPLTGKVARINEELLTSPELINQDAYEAWMVEISDIIAKEDLMDAANYEVFCKEEH